jgi:hypothetical protein
MKIFETFNSRLTLVISIIVGGIFTLFGIANGFPVMPALCAALIMVIISLIVFAAFAWSFRGK